jgi:hypothetical protein
MRIFEAIQKKKAAAGKSALEVYRALFRAVADRPTDDLTEDEIEKLLPVLEAMEIEPHDFDDYVSAQRNLLREAADAKKAFSDLRKLAPAEALTKALPLADEELQAAIAAKERAMPKINELFSKARAFLDEFDQRILKAQTARSREADRDLRVFKLRGGYPLLFDEVPAQPLANPQEQAAKEYEEIVRRTMGEKGVSRELAEMEARSRFRDRAIAAAHAAGQAPTRRTEAEKPQGYESPELNPREKEIPV